MRKNRCCGCYGSPLFLLRLVFNECGETWKIYEHIGTDCK